MSTRDPLDILTTMDPADGTVSPGQRARSAAALECIVASEPVRQPFSRPAPSRWGRRALLVGGVAAAATALSVARPGTFGSQMAYATWTAMPSAVQQGDLDAAVAACRRELRAYPAGAGERGSHFDPATIPVSLADRRGEIVSVVFTQDRPENVAAMCLATVRVDTAKVRDVSSGVGGSSAPAWVPPAGRIAAGAMAGYDDRAWQVSGTVGAGVRGVTVHLGSIAVQAKMSGHRFTAWGPGRAFTDPHQPSGEGGPQALLTYDVTLEDGRMLRHVASAMPE